MKPKVKEIYIKRNPILLRVFIHQKTLSVSEEGLYIDVSHYLIESGSKKRERVRPADGLCKLHLIFPLPLSLPKEGNLFPLERGSEGEEV